MKDRFYHRVIDFENRKVYVTPFIYTNRGYFQFGCVREYNF